MSEIIKEINEVPLVPVTPKKKKVSFSQYAMWMKCPRSWKLNYLDGLRKTDLNLSIFFGTAMHHALQVYLETLYKSGSNEASVLDVHKLFEDKLKEELAKEKEKEDKKIEENLTSEIKKDLSKFKYTEDELKEFIIDAEDILDFLLSPKNRYKYFPDNKYEFIGVEVPLDMEIMHNVNFIAFIDLILKDKKTGKYKIYDFKTSATGWNNYMKEDESKYSQILLYKAFYSRKFNVPLNDIEVEFFILKRKLWENVAFPQSRIQTFEPANGQKAIAESLDGFINFVQECFTPEGDFNVNAQYPKIPGKARKHCKYCGHYKSTCDGKADKIEQEIL
jgi:hypothetical protein